MCVEILVESAKLPHLSRLPLFILAAVEREDTRWRYVLTRKVTALRVSY